MNLYSLFSVALGGAGGAVSRYLVVLLINRIDFHGFPIAAFNFGGFPIATVAINIAGSFAMGLLLPLLLGLFPGSLALRDFLLVGFLGSFTTFSTFSMETVSLLQDGAIGRAALYVALSVGLGVMAFFIAYSLVKGL